MEERKRFRLTAPPGKQWTQMFINELSMELLVRVYALSDHSILEITQVEREISRQEIVEAIGNVTGYQLEEI